MKAYNIINLAIKLHKIDIAQASVCFKISRIVARHLKRKVFTHQNVAVEIRQPECIAAAATINA